MRKILHHLREGIINTNSLAQDLNISRGTLDAVLETAVREGYVEKISVNSNCGDCPPNGRCMLEPSECDRAGVYILTSKGRKYIEP